MFNLQKQKPHNTTNDVAIRFKEAKDKQKPHNTTNDIAIPFKGDKDRQILFDKNGNLAFSEHLLYDYDTNIFETYNIHASNDVFIDGSLNVTSIIKLPGLQLIPQSSNPGDATTLWVNNNHKLCLGLTEIGTLNNNSIITMNSENAIGPTAMIGLKGDTGESGPRGQNGSDGLDGSDGSDGLDGLDGLDGVTGATGAIGPIGVMGPTGQQGIPGEKGETGYMIIQGETGPTGLVGSPGPIGPQGSNGPQGIKGDTGPQGQQGMEGDVGQQGPTGPQGLVGQKGDTGPSGILSYKQDILNITINSAGGITQTRTLVSPLFSYDIKSANGDPNNTANKINISVNKEDIGSYDFNVTNNTGETVSLYVINHIASSNSGVFIGSDDDNIMIISDSTTNSYKFNTFNNLLGNVDNGSKLTMAVTNGIFDTI